MTCENPVLVKRIACECCGMKIGEVYEGLSDCGLNPYYIKVKLPDGTWTSDHYAPGLFEIIRIGSPQRTTNGGEK